MPFEQFFPRSFNVASIRANAPAAPGVYGISNSRAWIYIGETDNIQASLFNYLQDAGSAPNGSRPTGFVFEVCDSAARLARQDRLVLEYAPACNRLTAKSAS